jgi:RHS repeat-associated protein
MLAVSAVVAGTLTIYAPVQDSRASVDTSQPPPSPTASGTPTPTPTSTPPTEIALTTDAISFPAGGSFTLTATVDEAIQDSDSSLVVRDLSNDQVVAECDEGLICEAPNLAFITGAPREYQAFIGDLESQVVTVAREAWTVTLNSSLAEVRAGEVATLEASFNQDLGATGGAYGAAIFDVTTGKRLQTCLTGSACRVNVTGYESSANTTQYVAAVFDASDLDAELPSDAADVQSSSNVVEVARAAWEVTVTPDAELLWPGESTTVRVSANQDVGLTNGLYSIYVFEPRENRFLARCDSGTSCDITAYWSHADPWGAYYLAVVAERQALDPQSLADLNGFLASASADPGVQSPTWEIALDSTAYSLKSGESASLSASFNMDVSLTEGEYELYLVDVSQNRLLTSCDTGSTCTFDFAFWYPEDSGYPSADVFAIVDDPGATTLDEISRGGWHASGAPVTIERVQWAAELSYSGSGKFTLRANQNVAHLDGRWKWYLFHDGDRVGSCGSGDRCVFRTARGDGGGFYGYYTAILVRGTNPETTSEMRDVLSYTEVHRPVPVPSGPSHTSPISGRSETTGGHNPAEAPCECGRADPVNTATGEFFLPVEDLALEGAGPRLALARTYSSSGSRPDGPLGNGWVGNFQASLRPTITTDDDNPLPREVVVEQENGSVLLFTRDGASSAYVAPERVIAKLEWMHESSSWALSRREEQVLTFDASGSLTGVADQHGNSLHLSYSGGLIAQVSASGGRSLAFAWSSGRVASVTDSSGRTVSFSYDGSGNLVQSVAADGAVTNYEYDSEHRMTAFTRPGGGRTQNSYDDRGRVLSQTDPLGRVTYFQYDDLGTTSITDPDGSITIDRYQDGLLVEQTLAAGTANEAVTEYTYDERNLVSTVRDASGGVTTFEYDGHGNRTSRMDPLGRVTMWTYGDFRSPLTVTDPEGRVTTASYGGNGTLLSSVSPSGAESLWTHNADGTVATTADPLGRETSYLYDDAGRLLSTTDADGDVSTINYNAAGLPVSLTSAEGSTVTTVYDATGRVLTTTDGTGLVSTRTYDAAGNLATATNGAGETTSFAYDLAGQLLTSTNASGDVTHYAYDQAGNVMTVTDPNGNSRTATYDHYDNILTATDALGRTVSREYDLSGRVVKSVSASGAHTVLERDAAGQIMRSIDPLGDVTEFEYDLSGQRVAVEDSLGRLTRIGYDLDGRVSAVLFADGGQENYTYDAAGNLVRFTNADGQQTVYAYSEPGLRTSRTDPGGVVTEFEFDRDDRLSTRTSPDGTTTGYTYDARGLILSVDYSATPVVDETFEYDGGGRLTGVEDATGTTSLAYDEDGRLVSETDGSGDSLAYSYDAAGRLTTIAYPGLGDLTYEYDAADQMTELTDWNGRTLAFTWSADGRLATQTFPNGVHTTEKYDDAGRVENITTASEHSEIAAFDYVYDTAHQLQQVSETLTGATTARTFEFDPLGQLSGIGDPGQAVDTPIGATSAGALESGDDGATLSYDPAQRVTLRSPSGGPDTSYHYDSNGSRTSASVQSEVTTFEYDAAGHLSAFDGSQSSVSYTTDARGLRQTREAGHGSSDLVWSTVRSLPVLMADGDYAYVYGPSVTPVAQVDLASGDATFLHTDQLGSVRVTTDEDGVVRGTKTFTAFGRLASTSGDPATPFGFTGNWTDPLTGFVHLRAREYDPVTGQFLTVDPKVEVTLQPYTYADNNPLQLTDHTGLDYWSDFWGQVGINAAAFGAGALNSVTFGLSGMIMSEVVPGYDCFVEENSGFYAAGEITGTVATALVPGGVAVAGIRAVAGSMRGVATIVKAAEVAEVARVRPIGPVSDKAWAVVERVDAGQPPPMAGMRGGSAFWDRGGVLPWRTAYREWDVNPPIAGQFRDGERVVTGLDGSAYWTGDHYGNFVRFR